MTAVAGHVTTGRTAPAPPPADAPGPAWPPRLADGVELLGEYKGSGYSQPPSLVRRADGQVIQMSPLLYQVACRIDGSRDPDAIAALVSADLGRSLDAEQVRYLITAKLLPLGIVAAGGVPRAAAEGQPAVLAESAGHAAARADREPRRGVPPPAVPVARHRGRGRQRAGRGLVAVRRPRAGRRDPAGPARPGGPARRARPVPGLGRVPRVRARGRLPLRRRAARRDRRRHLPGLARRSSPTSPTPTGVSRAGRLRTDLGGLYFNVVFMLALAGIYAATSAQILLLVIAVTHLEMLDQLLPFVRFDGYFILSDLIGVPDLFARVVPILKSVLPAGRRDPRVTGLRRGARIVVTGWVLCVIPLLLFTMGYLLLHLPGVDRALWRSAQHAGAPDAAAVAGHSYAVAAVDAIGVVLVVLPVAGSLYIVARLARRVATLGRRWSAGRPARRLLAAGAGLAVMTALAAFWTIQGQFRGW